MQTLHRFCKEYLKQIANEVIFVQIRSTCSLQHIHLIGYNQGHFDGFQARCNLRPGKTNIRCRCLLYESYRPWGCQGCHGIPRSVNPISSQGGRLCISKNTGTPGFSDLPTALWLLMQQQAVGFFCMKTNGLWQFLLENMHKFCMKKLKVVSLFLSI